MCKLLLLVTLVFTGVNLFSQDITISGNVMSERNEPLPFVSVAVKGENFGTKTDILGNYKLTLKDTVGLTLIYSTVGYIKQTIVVGSKRTIDVKLLISSKELDEVVVVGYGTVRTKELTGATSKVGGEDIEKMNVARMDQALQGQVSGVNISTNSGSPGGSSNIRIRGLSTFGDNDPLILVDGVVYDSDGLNALNPSDIKSINVLKDATAGIYGLRAANGVITIEPTRGRLNAKPRIQYNGYYGIQQTARKLDLLTAEEYAVIKNEMFAFGGQEIPFNNTGLGIGTDWQDTIFQTAPMQSHNFTISGGTLNTTYSIGLGYFIQDGIVGGDKSQFSRYNGRVNLSTKLSSKLKLNSVFLFSSDDRSSLPENGIGSVLYNTINAFPTEPIKTPDGNFSYLEEVSDIINPVAQVQNQYNGAKADKFVGKEEFIFDFTDNLSFTNRINYNYSQINSKTFSPLVWYGEGKFANSALNEDLESPMVEIADSVFLERGASVYEERSSYVDLTYESYLNYDRVFDSVHRVKATGGISIFQRKGESLNGTGFNIPNNSLEFADISANQAAGGFLNNVGSWEFKERLLSAFIRAEYAYQSKYLVSAIIRRDGSSKFGENSRFGLFPTGSAAWLISEEDFFNSDIVKFLKFRASYGVSGNDQIDNFAYRALLNGEGVYVFNDVITQGAAIGRASNPDLKWETTRQLNLGLDMTLWKRLNFTTNYFVKSTFDLLFQPEVTAILGTYGPGGFPPIINAGDVKNNGFEFELKYATNPNKDLFANFNLNFTTIKNRVTGVPEGVDFLPGASFSVGGGVATRFEEGYEIGYFFGHEMDGIFQTQAEIDNAEVIQEGAQPGDIRFVDQDGDCVINFSDDSDKTYLGSAIPDFTMGFAFTVNYKGFDLSANFYASIGNEIIRNYERQQPYANQLGYVIDRWTGEGTTNEHPRVTTGATRNNIFSSYYVEDGSFLRLRNTQLGYSIPTKILKKAKIEGIRIYVSANNLFTLTRYQGYDPDIGGGGDPGADFDSRARSTLSGGVDYGLYPQAKTFMGGIQITF
ncbi:MAG: SusC/RagA family TonB-linked outer membrane protein [Crocinitomicaceae bacterium]